MKHKKLIISILIILILITSLIFDALYVKPHKLTIREEKLSSSKFEGLSKDLMIAYFSDIHYGLYTNSDDLDHLIEVINGVNPDVIIFGGDLFDNYSNLTSEDKDYVLNKLSELNAKIDKYAVLGEKDLISDSISTSVTNILEEAEFKLITNTNISIYKNSNLYFNLIGIDSLALGNPDISSAFNNINSSSYNLVVSHCPDIFDSLDQNLVDYCLAGHSHGVQIYFPLINYFYRPYGANKYVRGTYHKNGSTLDITSGVGLKEKSIRLFTDAEVVFYKIEAN